MAGIFKMVIDVLIFLIKVVLAAVAPFVLSSICWFIYYRVFKKMKLPKMHRPKQKLTDNLIIKLFILFPKRFVLDLFNRNPDEFDLYGLHLFCGEQGSGKTMTMCYTLFDILKKYPKVKLRTNFNFVGEVDTVTTWQDLIQSENGVFGQVEALDELQNWFSSMESKNFPPEMLTEITQQRKQRKIIMGTSQVFTRVSKPIREQVTFLYEPMTILGAFTICFVYKPNCDENGTILKKRLQRLFCFPHTDELRNGYDTYKKIERYTKVGFVERPSVINNSVVVSEKK